MLQALRDVFKAPGVEDVELCHNQFHACTIQFKHDHTVQSSQHWDDEFCKLHWLSMSIREGFEANCRWLWDDELAALWGCSGLYQTNRASPSKLLWRILPLSPFSLTSLMNLSNKLLWQILPLIFLCFTKRSFWAPFYLDKLQTFFEGNHAFSPCLAGCTTVYIPPVLSMQFQSL